MANLTGDGQTSTFNWRGGRGIFDAAGTFGGGTAKLQRSLDGGTTWDDVGDGTTQASLTADGQQQFYAAQNTKLRVDLSGSTSPDLDVYVLEAETK